MRRGSENQQRVLLAEPAAADPPTSSPITAARYRVVPERDLLPGLTLCWPEQLRARGEEALIPRAAKVLDELVRLGLPHAVGPAGEARYDPCEVMNFFKVAGEAGDCRAWDEYVAGGRRLIADLSGRGRRAVPWASFNVVFRREYVTASLPTDRALRLRLPAPFPCSTQESQVTISLPHPQAKIDDRTPGRVELVLPPGQTLPERLTVELRVDLRSAWERGLLDEPATATPALGAEERGLYTARREGIIVVSPRIQACADRLAQPTEAETLRRFWLFASALQFGHVHYDALDREDPLGQVLSTRWINCHVGAALLVALCRARGIPARVVAGFCLYPLAPYYHYWAEVHLEERGWIPVDFAGLPLGRRPTDESWRDVFYGRLDHRLKVECFPRIFTGSSGVRFPERWYMVVGARDGGMERRYHALDDGALLHRDWLSVSRTD